MANSTFMYKAKNSAWYTTGLEVTKSAASSTASAKLNMNRIVIAFTASADGDTVTVKTPFPFQIIGGHVLCKATVANGGLQVKNNTTAVTDVVACATDKAVTAIGTIDDAQYQFYAGDDDLVIDASGAANGLVVLDILPTMTDV